MRFALIACVLLTGCAPKHAAKVIIPVSCMKIRVVDFTKPCEELKGGEYMMCDQVKVKINCVAVQK